MKRSLPLVALLLLTLVLPACVTHLQKKENYLKEAGFRTVKPTTPEQIAHFQSLRKNHITHETRNGSTLFMLGIFFAVAGFMTWMMVKTCRELSKERPLSSIREA